MSKYKIINENGYTKLYEDGKQIKYIKSIKFERKSIDEFATITIEVFDTDGIEIIGDGQTKLEKKIINMSLDSETLTTPN